MFELAGRVAVVTGGAGAIGSAIANGLARQGASVVLVGRRRSPLEEAASTVVAADGAEVRVAPADVTDAASVDEVAAMVAADLGGADILVNSHGYNVKAAAEEFPMEEWDRLFAVNVAGTMHTCKAFGRQMIGRKSGKIVNVSSVRGVRANAGGNAAYAGSKAAVDMLTRSLAAEWARHSVNVNAIAPALIVTKLTEKQLAEPGRAERYLANIPWGRLGQAADCVGAAVFLASDEADFITGQVIYVDGGLSAVG